MLIMLIKFMPPIKLYMKNFFTDFNTFPTSLCFLPQNFQVSSVPFLLCRISPWIESQRVRNLSEHLKFLLTP